MRNAKDCLEISESHSLSPFCMAYAHEAVCRAAWIGGDADTASRHLVMATKHAKEISNMEDRGLIESDLQEIRKKIGSTQGSSQV